MQVQTQYERPPEGLQRGRYPAPKWAILGLGAVVVVGALLFLLWRARGAMRARAREGLRPPRRR